ncbi:MAG TPA: LysM peptidoglycan-binding domain-containing protein [Flavobacterium sp.]|jgi:LysM repeat protein
MKHFLFVLLPALLFASNVFGQDYIRHKVAKAETVTQIAKKYQVTPLDIYKLNPDSQNGLKENAVLIIPSSPTTSATASSKSHLVKPKETLYSIARDFNVSVDDLQKANSTVLRDGLKSGQTIKIPASRKPVASSNTEPVSSSVPKAVSGTKPEPVIFHIVEPGQTKFSIAKRYGITVEELDQRNPGILTTLPVGQRLSISGNDKTLAENSTERPGFTPQKVPSTITKKFANYEVKPKETLFSLSQMFDITTDELIAMNPTLQDGVKIGMILKVPGKGSIILENARLYKDLTTTIDNSKRKELVMLLPFNASRISGDSLTSVAARLKKDQFLNMTLDFYSGALMAIDSAKALGLNVNVRILDSKESKYSSGIDAILQKNELKKADAVIGPFYQQYLEKTAEAMAKDSIPVISPLSRETGKSYANLYQSMPSENQLKQALFNYMNSKSGNIIIVSDPKKVSNRDFITKNYPNVKFAKLTETGGLVTEYLKGLLLKDKMNYVILDSEKTGMILATTNLLLNQLDNYQIQMAILEPNETLDFEEISMNRLTILKMLQPSVTRDNQSDAANNFAAAYKAKNKIFPNQYATRGFDVTFDTLLRLQQGKSFSQCISEDITEQIESRFNYIRDAQGGFINKGVYILQYNEDLSVTEASQ